MNKNEEIDKRLEYYEHKTRFNHVLIQAKGEKILLIESKPFSKRVILLPKQWLSEEIQFSRQYHIGPFVSGATLFFMSSYLLFKRWGQDHWSLYLAYGLIFVVVLAGLYYLLVGKKYGEVSLEFAGHGVDSNRINLYIKEEEYDKLNRFISKFKK